MINILPFDGAAYYFPNLFSSFENEQIFHALLKNISWKNDEVMLFGKKHITDRKTAWYSTNNKDYAYSGSIKRASPFTEELLALKKMAEVKCGELFNGCLLNLYHSGKQGMGWHSDNEKSIVSNSAIASFSFGADRKFNFKHKISRQIISVMLENGSLLVMSDATQSNWLHNLPKSAKVLEPRINLTFRRMV